jgi:uncharacterized repeat protein (TIGR01451 family)
MIKGGPTDQSVFVFHHVLLIFGKLAWLLENTYSQEEILMKRTAWRALLVVALLSIVFVALPVSATILTSEQVTRLDDSAPAVNFSPLSPTDDGITVTATVTPTEISQYGPYYLTYKTVITNGNDYTATNTLPITFTLDSDLSLVSLYVNGETGSEQGTVLLSGGTVILPSGGTVITLTGSAVISPGGSLVLPEAGTVVLLPDCSLYLAPGGTMLLPGGGVILMNSVLSWRAVAMPPNSVTTLTLVARGAALWDYDVQTLLQVFDRSVISLTTLIRPEASAGMSVIVRGPTTAKRGEVITYTIAFSNVSTLPVYNVWVTDTLPTGVVPLPGVQTTMFTPVAPPAQLFEYRLPVRVVAQGTTLVNRVSVSALGLQLDPIVGNFAFWNTVIDTIYTIYLPVIRY